MGRKRKSNGSNPERKAASQPRNPLNAHPCTYCHDLILNNLVQHERICRLNHIARDQVMEYVRLKRAPPGSNSTAPRHQIQTTVPSSSPMDDIRGLSPPPSPEHTPMDVDDHSVLMDSNMRLPDRFIYVRHHPHSGKPDEIIALDSAGDSSSFQKPGEISVPTDRPWAPFRSLADATFAYRCVSRRLPNKQVDEDLVSLRAEWAENSRVTFRNHREMLKSVDAAREGNIRFETRNLSFHFEGRYYGGTYQAELHFRDAWKVMKRWVRDETLVPLSTWFSQERYVCANGEISLSNPLYDEPCTGTDWAAVDDSLPADDKYPACFLPAHIWLDKGLVTTKVKMHPILLRGCWIESATRNGSGNGGAALLGFVVMPAALREIDPQSLKGARRTEYDTLKRKIYHEVCRILLSTLESRSRRGEALRFGDGVTRVAHPGFLIESMDFEELAAWLGIRNSRSLHPCPKCLVHHDDLHKLFHRCEPRTPRSMKAVMEKADELNVTEREELLKSYGLHYFMHFLWSFRHTNLYAAACYDLLHYFDGGKWGRHVWKLINEYLQSHELASKFNEYMSQFPSWRGLKHIPSPTTITYSDGQTFVDILKSALPCLVQLIPARDACLVRIVRVMQKVRIMLGLWVTTRTRLDHLNDLVGEYQHACDNVHSVLDKDFNFLKQHSLSHAIEDFMSKGTSRNMNTRVGEGFQQEVEKMYSKTNGKNAERQIGEQDEREEAMARVQMAIDNWCRQQEDADLEPGEKEVIPTSSNKHWRLGSPVRRVSSHRLEVERKGELAFRNFNMRLREYIAQHHVMHRVRLEQQIEIEQCKVVYVEYQSKVDWRSARDILRSNPRFHNAPRYDSVLYEDEEGPVALGKLHFVFRCHLPGGITLDLAIVQPFRGTNWQPKTRTDCEIRELLPLNKCHFISLEHIVRGALLSPIFGGKEGMHYIIDCVDEDMYLRLHDID